MSDTVTRPVIRREFVINRQGKDFVLYSGLLDAATEAGLREIDVEALQISPTLAVFKATASFADGRKFSAHGDATPENVGRNIAPHFCRMAETRAKARALRDALNIGSVALEELGDLGDDEPHRAPPPRPPPPVAAARAAPAPPAPAAPTPIRPPVPAGAPVPPAQPGLLHHPDEVDEWLAEQLVEACAQMAEKLAGAGIAAGPMPSGAERTKLALRAWYRTGYASLTPPAPAQPALIASPPPAPRSHYDDAPSVPRRTR